MKTMAALLVVACLLAGCVRDELETEPEPSADGAVTVTLNVPTPHTMGTYAMNAKQECDIVTVDVLVFHPDGTFLYREMGTGVSDGVADNKKYFSVKIKKTHDPNNVSAFVYANVRSAIDAALEGDRKWIIPGITTKEDVIEKLVFDLPTDQTAAAEGGKWLVLPGRYTRFPMWGKTANIDLTAASVSIPEVTMLRSVAKIDVGLAFPTSGTQAEQDVPAGLSNFHLEEFYLYNAYNKLQVAPTASNLNGTAVTAPSVPAGAAIFGSDDKPITYARRSYNADGYKSFMSEIYLSEHEAGADDDRPNNPCIVVGGRFGTLAQAQAKSVPVTYYRIDMVKSTLTDGVITAQEYLALLRNHRYKINITAVHERGYDTPREAFDAMGLNTNMSVVITSEDERVNEIVYDGQYMMGVDKTIITVDKRIHTGKQLYIKTDYPLGWKATSNASWLTVTNTSGAKDGSWLTYNVVANTGVVRSGTITLQAGRLFMTIQVIQSNVADIELLNLQQNNIYAMIGAKNTFTLKANYNWKAKVVDDEYNIITDFMSFGTTNMNGINYEFTLIDDFALNSFLVDKTAKIIFYSETDEFEQESIQIRGLTPFSLAGLEVYPVDQPTGFNWYTYANIPDNTNNTIVPGQGTTGQVNPPRTNSCASRSNGVNSQWRLPTESEILAIYKAIANGGINPQLLNFVTTSKYSSATTPSTTYCIRYLDWAAGEVTSALSVTKSITTNRARCIRKR